MSFAKRICRSCMATTEQIQVDFTEDKYERRTMQKHKDQLEELKHDPSKSVEYGASVLDEIPHVSVAENIPHDVMHDLLEGVVPYEMRLLLTFLVNAKHITIPTLNDRLKRFDFGYTESSDRPSPIDENIVKKVRQSATKMWILATFLPLLIGDLIPDDCEHYALFHLLLKICTVAMAWETSPGAVSYLRVLIEEHLKTLYPNNTIIPKMHYMLHYPSQILKYGPLVHSWTMRHEAKLHTIKRAARHGNFKNISYTIAKRSQHAFCYHLKCGNPFLIRSTEISTTCVETYIESETEQLQSFIVESCLNIKSVRHLTWMKYGCFHLKKNAFVYLGNGDLYPKFGKVSDVLGFVGHDDSLRYAVCLEKCETLYFDSHFNRYVIEP